MCRVQGAREDLQDPGAVSNSNVVDLAKERISDYIDTEKRAGRLKSPRMASIGVRG